MQVGQAQHGRYIAQTGGEAEILDRFWQITLDPLALGQDAGQIVIGHDIALFGGPFIPVQGAHGGAPTAVTIGLDMGLVFAADPGFELPNGAHGGGRRRRNGLIQIRHNSMNGPRSRRCFIFERRWLS